VLAHEPRQAGSWLTFNVRQKMKMKCLACGSEKNTSEKEVYPYPEDGIIDDPICPLTVIECRGSDWRAVIVCHHCQHRLDPDMWISDRCWSSLKPNTPFDQLPFPAEDTGIRFDVETYAIAPK
jgi:hypothetical protein